MDEKLLLAALLDLRIAIGEFQAAMTDVEKAARELTAVLLGVKREEAERENHKNEPEPE